MKTEQNQEKEKKYLLALSHLFTFANNDSTHDFLF